MVIIPSIHQLTIFKALADDLAILEALVVGLSFQIRLSHFVNVVASLFSRRYVANMLHEECSVRFPASGQEVNWDECASCRSSCF